LYWYDPRVPIFEAVADVLERLAVPVEVPALVVDGSMIMLADLSGTLVDVPVRELFVNLFVNILLLGGDD